MSTTRFLTGITTTGVPHLGNFVGSIRPSVAASLRPGVQSFYFLADYHALIKCEDPARIQRSTLEIAASWLAAGLDPERVTFYRQSDIPEIPELTWLLTCVTGKGLLNRAHAYKAAGDRNTAAGREADDGVTAGLFMYPLLMGADILLFKAHQVPVGRDQVQHIEMARAMATSFNHLYGAHFVLPEAAVDAHVATLPGLDGRKMSKSYDNTIPLFSSRAQLQKLIAAIRTDSRPPGEPKDTEGSALFEIYRAFAGPEETGALRRQYAEGIAWGDAKQQLLDRVDQAIAPMRAQYQALIDRPERIEQTLLAGAERARALATPFLRELRRSVGLRSLAPPTGAPVAKAEKAQKAPKAALPAFKQYREADGRFYFKLVAADGRLLLQSTGFDAPREAGQAIRQLQQDAAALQALAPRLVPVDGVDRAEVAAALQDLADAAMAE
ncbi:tryptophan--tRNA ligase [Verminephrobacter aporrectodeae]|uniref:tryptophan--tRNA ligase n=1 Tax=Verminephrobacter aporrectodeae TaxID=1110389 RepID=UPI0022436DD2|nr:tryptophan--tRNA ligase [Verminephrobacter aporrectodeae]MCW8174333.1 tryptophan--tRNA ligase [Verminephrobacter aporrectodeae subsp. tuberculatae]MCW8202123.1 tryptophan--tRNA ligase [Verminephrobacter aporrectodeae subsp. tuberculatae]